MKNILKKAGLFVAVLLTVVSCLKDKEVVNYPQCAITSFTVGNITTYFNTKTSDGLYDSIYTRVIDGSSIGFNIDQLKGEIESVDSIIGWADISRVVPTITYTGLIFCKQRGWDNYYSFTSGVDSVDFTQDVEFLVFSTDQQNNRIYKAKLNKAKLVADSLYWTDMASTSLTLSGVHRSVSLGSRIYAFADNSGAPTVTSFDTATESAWTTPAALTGCGSTLDVRTVVVFNDKFYALAADGHLYSSDAAVQGVAWTQAGDVTLTSLLCADPTYLYAYDGSKIVQSSDLLTWTANGVTDLDKLPVAPVQSAYYQTKTHAGMQHVVMLGLTNESTRNTTCWYKVSSSDKDLNQQWNHLPAPAGSDYVLPVMESLTMVRLGDQLVAFGGADPNTGDTAQAFKTIYTSDDNGLSWQPHTTRILLPKELNENPTLPVSAVVVNGKIWLLQSGGKVWCGTIGKK